MHGEKNLKDVKNSCMRKMILGMGAWIMTQNQ